MVELPQNAPTQVRSFYDQVYSRLPPAPQHFAAIKNITPKNTGNTWTWEYIPPGSGGMLVTLKAVLLAGDSSQWTISWQGGLLSSVWISDEGKITADGKYGSWKLYYFNGTFLERTAVWQKNDQNIIVINATRWHYPDPASELFGIYREFLLTGSPDASGTLQAIEQGIKIFEAVWQASGAGTWAAYDASSGQQTDGGSWTP
jgi:hypothetical protein